LVERQAFSASPPSFALSSLLPTIIFFLLLPFFLLYGRPPLLYRSQRSARSFFSSTNAGHCPPVPFFPLLFPLQSTAALMPRAVDDFVRSPLFPFPPHLYFPSIVFDQSSHSKREIRFDSSLPLFLFWKRPCSAVFLPFDSPHSCNFSFSRASSREARHADGTMFSLHCLFSFHIDDLLSRLLFF